MDLGAVLFLLALSILVVVFVGRPFLAGGSFAPPASQESSALLAERERILSLLQEFDFDHAQGKIPSEDYPVQRAALLARGANVLRRLDELEGKSAAPPKRSAAAKPGLSDDELEDRIASRRQARREKSGGFCPRCGKPVLLADKFCPACGHALK